MQAAHFLLLSYRYMHWQQQMQCVKVQCLAAAGGMCSTHPTESHASSVYDSCSLLVGCCDAQQALADGHSTQSTDVQLSIA